MALMLGSASPAPATTEQELIDAARCGDDRAFEELYARYRERIGMFIRSRLRDHARAEDVAQEVFISALRRLRGSDQTVVFKPWIYEIAKNACIDEYRRSQRSREVSLDADAELSNGQGALLSIAPTPPAAMESKQKLDDLRGAFGGLSKGHHQLLVMREFEGLTYDEIGHRTGMSRQMVESALFRARRKLGVEYEELASGRRCLQVQTAIEAGKLTSRRSLGVRERRQLARHLAHCQPCRVKARVAGVDDSFVRSGVGAKIAALLPFPALRWWPFGRAARAAARTGSHPGLQVAAGALEPGTSTLLGGAAVAITALAIAGPGLHAGAPVRHPAHATRAALSAHPASAARPGSSPRQFSPGSGTAPAAHPRNGVVRLTHYSAVPAHPVRAGRPSGGTANKPGSSVRMGAGAPAARPPLSAAKTVASPGGSTAASPVQGAGTTVKPVLQNTTKSVGNGIAQTPVAKTVAKVLATAPGLSPATGSGHGSPSPLSAAPAPPIAAPVSRSTAGSASSTVQSVTKKVTNSVGSALTQP
jgi:RNA polymerase sigma factor (sigma-70 family)